MPKFSDNPYFLLEDFFTKTVPEFDLEIESVEELWPTAFGSPLANDAGDIVEISDSRFTLDDTNDAEQDLKGSVWVSDPAELTFVYQTKEYEIKNSYLIGPETTIITTGDGIHTVYVKDEDYGFRPINIKIEKVLNNLFHFDKFDILTYIPSDTISEVVSGAAHEFIYYDSWFDASAQTAIKAGQEVYFRKDSYFHEWLRTQAEDDFVYKWEEKLDIRNYVNTDKTFNYFGKIYGSSDHNNTKTKFHIIFDGMKDYATNAIPAHQRTENLRIFNDIYFDRIYQQGYNQLKNVWTMIDPMEIDIRHLGYLSNYYDMGDVDISTDELRSREFVRDLIYLIKRKGTYSDLYVLWNLMTQSNNYLNIYEMWHAGSITGQVGDSDWNEYLYTFKDQYNWSAHTGGAGQWWYENLPTHPWDGTTNVSYPTDMSLGGEIASTHYKIEFDVNNKPLNMTGIFPEDDANRIYEYLDTVRPVNRVSHHRIVFSPITDLSQRQIPLYNDFDHIGHCVTNSDVKLVTEGAFVGVQDEEAEVWNFTHGLDTGMLQTMVLDENMNEILPSDIIFVDDDNIQLVFPEPTKGNLLVKNAQWFGRRRNPIVDPTWRLIHLFSHKEAIIQFKDFDEHKIYGGGVKLVDENEAEADVYEEAIAMANKSDTIIFQPTASTVWTLPHELHMKGVILSCYNNDGEQVHPTRITLIDDDNCEVEFDVPVSGYAVFILIGFIDMQQLFESPTWRVGENNDRLETYNDQGFILEVLEDEDFWYLEFELDASKEHNINEIGLMDNRGSMVFYTSMKNLFKPKDTELRMHFRVSKVFFP